MREVEYFVAGAGGRNFSPPVCSSSSAIGVFSAHFAGLEADSGGKFYPAPK